LNNWYAAACSVASASATGRGNCQCWPATCWPATTNVAELEIGGTQFAFRGTCRGAVRSSRARAGRYYGNLNGTCVESEIPGSIREYQESRSGAGYHGSLISGSQAPPGTKGYRRVIRDIRNQDHWQGWGVSLPQWQVLSLISLIQHRTALAGATHSSDTAAAVLLT
jgi:hypothetical protein